MTAENLAAVFSDAVARRDRAAVRDSAVALIASGASIGDRWGAVAQAMRADGEVALAIAASERWLDAAPGDRVRRFGHADLMARYGRLDAAEAVLHGNYGPGDVDALHFLGTIALQQNRPAAARALLQQAVSVAPMAGRSWHALTQVSDLTDAANTRSAPQPGEDGGFGAALLAAGTAISRASPIDRAAWHSAVGQVHAARDEHAAAFRAFDAAGAIMSGLRRYDAVADEDGAARSMATWSAARVTTLTLEQPRVGMRPILVGGPPRSGTTLVARILTAHPQVGGGDEVNLFTAAAYPLDVTDGAALAAAGGAAHRALAARYRRVLAERSGDAPVLVDKTLSLSRYLGAAAALLPDAALVWVRRDRHDTGWSAFRTFFPDGVGWSWAPAAVTAHLAIEDRLLAHWRAVLGPRLLVVDYEALVRDTPAQTARLLRHCGLPDDPACVRPERQGGAVTTASTVQVRRPVSVDAIGASAPYAALWAVRHGNA